MAQSGDEEKRDDFATPGARAYADAALALAIGILGFIVSAFLNLEHRWHEFVGHEDIGMHLEELPIAMFVAGLVNPQKVWIRNDIASITLAPLAIGDRMGAGVVGIIH